MPISKAFAFLTPPGKGASGCGAISGKEIPLGTGKLFRMLDGIFSGDASSRDFEITFNPAIEGVQVNDCRNLFIEFEAAPTQDNGLAIAQRLHRATDNRSGDGLLFLLVGVNGTKRRLIVSRFPTDEAILAEVSSEGLAVEFLEQVFIKRLSSYKAVMLEHHVPKDGYWKGFATDRQAGQSGEHISEYWLKDFLNADFSETAAAGTRRLATALKQAVKSTPNLSIKSEIAHASTLAPAVFKGKSITIDDFCERFGFSQSARDTVINQLAKPSLSGKKFQFDHNEFRIVAPYRTVEMNNGAILTAPNDDFERVFELKSSDNGEVEYTTKGKISDQRLARK